MREPPACRLPPPLRSHMLCSRGGQCAAPASLWGRSAVCWLVGIKLPKGSVLLIAGLQAARGGGTRGYWTRTSRLAYFGTPRSQPCHMAGQRKFTPPDPLCHFVVCCLCLKKLDYSLKGWLVLAGEGNSDRVSVQSRPRSQWSCPPSSTSHYEQ